MKKVKVKKIRNESGFDVTNTTYDEYVMWCLIKKLNPKDKESRRKFFKDVHSGKIVRNINGKLFEKEKRIY